MESPDAITLRSISPDEIDEAIAIDADACTLYASAGLGMDFPPEHPFARDERACWIAAAREGRAFLAVAPGGAAVALLVLDLLDSLRYLEQLSVRRSAMRRGIGRFLLRKAIHWAEGAPLWLTTYSHVSWNRPFYEREGFEVVPESGCPAGIGAILEEQRRWLPAPEQRVAMRLRRPAASG